jgi:hypothetical protein
MPANGKPRVYNMRKAHPREVVLVDNMSSWGNPFSCQVLSTAAWRTNNRDAAIEAYTLWLSLPEQAELRQHMREHLGGKNLGCWCKPDRCHGDAILQVANSPEGPPPLAEDWIRKRLKELSDYA